MEGTARFERTLARVLHVTSNGHGMGHLSRQAAIALSDADPAEHAIASLSTAAPLLRGLGLRSEYIAGFDRGQIPRARWDAYLRDRLGALVDLTGARVMIFDADTPHQYPGVLLAAQRHPHLRTVWCRRGFWHRGFEEILPWADGFDAVLEPGDLVAELDDGATSGLPAHRIRPVSMLDALRRVRGPLPDRATAAATLGLDPDRPAVLVSLGSGTLGAAASAAQSALAHLADADWQVVLTQAPIAGVSPLAEDPRVRVLSGVFPLALYLAAFDAAVLSAGYNGVHEVIPARIPALVIPNPVWAIDNQHARARSLATAGLALYAHPADDEGIAAAVRTLLTPTWRAEQSERLARAAAAGRLDISGGLEAAVWLSGLAEAPPTANAISTDPAAAALAQRRATVLGRVGAPLTSLGLRLMGATVRRAHPPVPGPARPRRVRIASEGAGPQVLRMEHADGPSALRGETVVEDLISEDAGYRAARLALARDYYRIEGVGPGSA